MCHVSWRPLRCAISPYYSPHSLHPREVQQHRRRELEAAALNKSLRRQLRAALNDVDAITMRREVRTLRADLSAALAREAALTRDIMVAQRHLEADRVTISANAANEQKLRDDLDYMRRIAAGAMSARAHEAMGVPPAWTATAPDAYHRDVMWR